MSKHDIALAIVLSVLLIGIPGFCYVIAPAFHWLGL